MWYVLQTMSGEEVKCINLCTAILDKSDYREMFIPRHIVKKRYCKEWHDKIKVMFPGYVFIDCDEPGIEHILLKLWKVPQLTKMLRDADKVAPITGEEEAFLRRILDDDYIVRYSEGFIVGQRVCITEGALRDVSGHIKKVDRHRRIAYLDIDFLGRQTPVEVGLSAVARVTEEEFEKIRQRNIREHESRNNGDNTAGLNPLVMPDSGVDSDSNMEESLESGSGREVRILSGILEGMYGTFLSADTDRDEWTVLVRLFGEKADRVVFHRNEIQMI